MEDYEILKMSDVGFLVGKQGSDVATLGSDVIIRKESYAQLLDTIYHGRNIFRVVKEFLRF